MSISSSLIKSGTLCIHGDLSQKHRDRVKEIFQEVSLEAPGSFSLNGGHFSPPEGLSSEGAEELRRIVRVYQHAGKVSSPAFPNGVLLYSRNKVNAVYNVPGLNGNLVAGARVADDGLELVRNILFATLGANNTIARHLGYYAGAIWTFLSLREFDDGMREYNHSHRIGDQEGVKRSYTKMASGGVVGCGASLFLSGRLLTLFGSYGVASALLGVSSALFGVGFVIGIRSCAMGAIRCSKFQGRLNEYMNNEKLLLEERVRGALRFLRGSITVTQEELEKIQSEVDKDPKIGEKASEIEKRVKNLTETKVLYMKRRTSVRSLKNILDDVDSILEKMKNPETKEKAIKDGLKLILDVQKDSLAKKTLYILGTIAACIALASAIIGIFSSGPISFLLFGTTSILYLLCSLYWISGFYLRSKAAVPPALSSPESLQCLQKA